MPGRLYRKLKGFVTPRKPRENYVDNPYESPPLGDQPKATRASLFGPALGILVVSLIWVFFCLFGVVYQLSIITNPETLPENRNFPITIMLYALISMGYSLLLASGASSMLRTKSYLWAYATSILACVPIGPCYVLAIPWGVWGIRVLSRPEVRASFSKP